MKTRRKPIWTKSDESRFEKLKRETKEGDPWPEEYLRLQRRACGIVHANKTHKMVRALRSMDRRIARIQRTLGGDE